jgi:hypothetical protein
MRPSARANEPKPDRLELSAKSVETPSESASEPDTDESATSEADSLPVTDVFSSAGPVDTTLCVLAMHPALSTSMTPAIIAFNLIVSPSYDSFRNHQRGAMLRVSV